MIQIQTGNGFQILNPQFTNEICKQRTRKKVPFYASAIPSF